MKKDFDRWNREKKHLDAKKHNATFKEREIWWCDLGLNIGHEMDGSGNDFGRPVLILRRYNEYAAWVLTRTEKGLPFYHILKTKKVCGSRVSLTQGKLISSKRLRNRIVKINDVEFREIQEELTSIICRGRK